MSEREGRDEGRTERTDSDTGTDTCVHRPDGEPRTTSRNGEFGTQGWLLVGAIVLAFLVIPGLIYANAIGVFDLPFQFAFLILPLLPAVALAILAVRITTTR